MWLYSESYKYRAKVTLTSFPSAVVFWDFSSFLFLSSNNRGEKSGTNGEGRDLLEKINVRNKHWMYWCRVSVKTQASAQGPGMVT